jgi:hypothetical protein
VRTILFILVILLTLGTAVQADESDSVRVDTLEGVTIVPCDTCPGPRDTLDVGPDSLTAAQQALADFESRRQKVQDSLYVPRPMPSFRDTVLALLGSPRLSIRPEIERSFYHDAGDYFRLDPGYFVLDNQVTPMRKTVQPFGLSGDRLALFPSGNYAHPFEHTLEPDGLTDMNDLPTALDHAVYLLPGPVGVLLGGHSGVAALVTRPKIPASTIPESAFLVDKGSYAYSFARGRLSKTFRGGRDINMSVGYRNADGPVFGRQDDVYHYYVDGLFPIGSHYALAATGRLYDRSGPLLVRPDRGGASVSRDRIDRQADVALYRSNLDRTYRVGLGYSHVRQASRYFDEYDGNFNYTGHAASFTWDRLTSAGVVNLEVEGRYLEYDWAAGRNERYSGRAMVGYAGHSGGWGFAVSAGTDYVESFNALPRAALAVTRETGGSLLLVSVGYAERAPSQHELYLPHQRAQLYGTGTFDYGDEGNPEMTSERQAVGSATLQLGSIDNSATLTVVGGKLFDGIDWWRSIVPEGSGSYTLFRPENRDVTFTTATLSKRVRLADFLRFFGGASYHYTDYEEVSGRPFDPEYQAFSGLELHVYWPQTNLHLFAYGEVVYSGPYDGYDQTVLGQEPIVNAKLAFRSGGFGFQFVSQNSLGRQYTERDYFTHIGRYSYFRINWYFLD